jgi:hypothetical protein
MAVFDPRFSCSGAKGATSMATEYASPKPANTVTMAAAVMPR